MLVIGQLKGQLTNNVCVSGQNRSRARAVVSRFPELIMLITRLITDRIRSVLLPLLIIFLFLRKRITMSSSILTFCHTFD